MSIKSVKLANFLFSTHLHNRDGANQGSRGNNQGGHCLRLLSPACPVSVQCTQRPSQSAKVTLATCSAGENPPRSSAGGQGWSRRL